MAPKPTRVIRENDDSENFEELDLVRRSGDSTMSWVQAYLKDLSKAPVAKQTAVGGISGWVVGYMSMKVGKLAATVVGGTMIIMQLAAYQGYIKVDWSKVNKDFNKNAQTLTKEVKSRLNTGVAQTKSVTKAIDKKIADNIRLLSNIENEAESWFNKKLKLGQRMYRRYILGERELTIQDLYAINVYVVAFSVGTMLGVTCGKVL